MNNMGQKLRYRVLFQEIQNSSSEVLEAEDRDNEGAWNRKWKKNSHHIPPVPE